MQKLRIVHCFRTPLGGLFRHVLDLAESQADAGHDVGLITGDLDEWPMARQKIDQLRSRLSLGVHSFPMSRVLGYQEIINLVYIRRVLKKIKPDVIHGHGAKGGFYARICGIRLANVFYTPHGGSLHYSRASVLGRIFFAIEFLLAYATKGIIFESIYAQESYKTKIGAPGCRYTVIYNGLRDSEFDPVINTNAQYDLAFIGELRFLKGIDILLRALSMWPDANSKPRCLMAGVGRDADELKALAEKLNLGDRVHFIGAKPAREVFSQAKLFVLPSRAESLPYIVLEVLAAKIPAVVTRVGGIPEIYGNQSDQLVEPDNVQALLAAMLRATKDINAYSEGLKPVYQRVSDIFRASMMATAVTAFYAQSEEHDSP